MIKKGSVGVCDLPVPTRFCEQCMTMTAPDIQSSQVDLLAKSEIFDNVPIVCDTAGQTLLGGSGGMLPQEISAIMFRMVHFTSLWSAYVNLCNCH